MMVAKILLGFVVLAMGTAPVETAFMQVHPVPPGGVLTRSPGRTRAVVLIHGFRLRVSDQEVRSAEFHSWQRTGSMLVRILGAEADVYSFAYGQNVSVEAIAETPTLAARIKKLKSLGYESIVLVGHSAGGLVARYFVEDHPGAGVTKVIQVCTPNGGCDLGNAAVRLPGNQEVFARSLTKEARRNSLLNRRAKQIPDDVQFVCVVGTAGGLSDGVVACDCQWSKELRELGIPAVPVETTHFTMMRSEAGANILARIMRENYPRWQAKDVTATLRRIPGITLRNQ